MRILARTLFRLTMPETPPGVAGRATPGLAAR
jgi:hypothetical protein